MIQDPLEKSREAVRRYRAKNRKALNEQSRKHMAEVRAADPEGVRARENAYWKANPEKKREKKRRWYLRHREEVIAQSLQWAKDNPEKKREIRRRRRARVLNAEGNVTAGEFAVLCAAYAFRCGYCFLKKKLTMDHAIPLTRGGSHTIDNIIPACKSCNCQKRAWTDGEFFSLFRLPALRRI